MRRAGSAASAAASGSSLGPARSTLTGRVLFRSNERPVASLDTIFNEMGADFFHIKSQPAVMAVLKSRMGRGVQMANTFVFKHLAADSTWLEAMHELQVKNTPPNISMKEEDVIDCGFRSGQRRKRFETTFTVIFPDVKDGTDKRHGGDVLPEAGGYAAGSWHPQSGLTKLDMPLLTNGGASSSGGSSKPGKPSTKPSGAAPKAASGGMLGGLLSRATGSATGSKGAEGPLKKGWTRATDDKGDVWCE